MIKLEIMRLKPVKIKIKKKTFLQYPYHGLALNCNVRGILNTSNLFWKL